MAPPDAWDGRLRTVETKQEVHEAICAERYKGIALRLNVILAGIGIILTAIAAGDPLVGLIRRACLGG